MLSSVCTFVQPRFFDKAYRKFALFFTVKTFYIGCGHFFCDSTEGVSNEGVFRIFFSREKLNFRKSDFRIYTQTCPHYYIRRLSSIQYILQIGWAWP